MLPFNILTYRQLARILGPLFPEPLGDAGQMKSMHARSPAGSPGSFGSRSPAPKRALCSLPSCSLLPLALGILLAAAIPASSQVPTPSQAPQALQQAVQQNPGLADVIRQRIAQSGMTPDQIRARLQASGYPPTLLDAYLGGQTPGQAAPVPGTQELAAIQSLGLQSMATAGGGLPVETAPVRPRAAATSAVCGGLALPRPPPPFRPPLP